MSYGRPNTYDETEFQEKNNFLICINLVQMVFTLPIKMVREIAQWKMI